MLPPARHTSHIRLLVVFGIILAVVIAILVGVSVLITPKTQPVTCLPDCTTPPVGPPVQVFPRFHPDDNSFTVAYRDSQPFTATKVNDRAYHGIRMVVNTLDGEILLVGAPANNQTPRQIAQHLIQQKFPGAKTKYEIPNAMVGYEPGYGEVDDFWPVSGASNYTRLRVLAMVAVKNDLALIAFADGPYVKFQRGGTPGARPEAITDHPSGVDVRIADVMGFFVNSFTWRGDPPR